MITNPHHLAAALIELADQNSPSMTSWVSARLRDIADNLVEPGDDEDDWIYPTATSVAESETEA
jgi:hypothetical protein